jgi:hypothetical protein
MKSFTFSLLFIAGIAGAQPRLQVTDPETISPSGSYSKYVSVVRDGRGETWASYTSSEAGKDVLYVSKRQASGGWDSPLRLDNGEGSESFSSLVTTPTGDLWVFWQGIRHDSAVVYARVRHGGRWGPEEKVSRPGVLAMHPKVLATKDGKIWVVYEHVEPNRIDLEVRVFDWGKWSAVYEASAFAFSRRVSLAEAMDGGVWMAFDSPESGNYDVYLKHMADMAGAFRSDEAIPVTRDAGIDDSPSLLVGKDGIVWIAWNSCRSLRSEGDRSKQHSGAIFLKGYRNGQWIAPGKIYAGAMDGQVSLPDFDKTPDDAVEPYWHWKETQNYPFLFTDRAGRIWVLWRAEPTGAHNFDIFARVYDGGRWSDVHNLTAFALGRDEWPQLQAVSDSTMRLFWEGQELPPPGQELAFRGGDVDVYNTRANRNVILSGKLVIPAGLCHLAAASYGFPEESAQVANDLEKPLPVASALERTDSVTGKHLYFGDIHSHTVYSDGKYGWPDQLLWLSREKLGIDFSCISDHAEMGTLQRSEFDELVLMAKTFSQEGRYIDYLGFEWTAPVDFGHRILLFPGLTGRTLSSALPEGNSIEKLYAFAREYGAIVSAHHTAQATWGRWNPGASWSPRQEPNFELASWHGRFEYYNNPHEGRRQVPGHQYQDALKLGRRVGVLGSSDTHFLSPGEGGLTGVWSDSMSRSSIFSAIASRHTYATTGARIGLQLHINGRLMGSELRCDTGLVVEVAVQGTAAIDHIEVVKDAGDAYALIRITQPAGKRGGVFLLYDPARPQSGNNIPSEDLCRVRFRVHEPASSKPSSYYIRVTQVDGQQAWSSPIWVN